MIGSNAMQRLGPGALALMRGGGLVPQGGPGAADILSSLPALPDRLPRRGGINGILDPIRDWLDVGENRAALLRSGAATMQGGLGAGIATGAAFMDQRRAQREEGRRWDLGHGLQRFTAEENAAVNRLEAAERERHQRATEDLTMRGQNIDWQRHRTPSGTAQLGEQGANFRAQLGENGANFRAQLSAAMQREGMSRDAAEKAADRQLQLYMHQTPSGSVQAQAAGIGSRGATVSSGPRGTTVRMPLNPQAMEQNIRGAIPGLGGASPEVRYDQQGNAYVRGGNGEAVRAPQYDRR